MSIDAEPATRVERDLREQAVAPVAAACTGRIAYGDGAEIPEGALVTCFDVLDRTEHIAPVVDALLSAARQRSATVVVGVPNDALGGVGGASAWGEGSLAELRSLLPAEHVVAGIYELRGAAIVRDCAEAPETVSVQGTPDGAPSGWLLAFGQHADALGGAAAAAPIDRAEQRRWERAREGELEALRAMTRDTPAAGGPPRQLPAGS